MNSCNAGILPAYITKTTQHTPHNPAPIHPRTTPFFYFPFSIFYFSVPPLCLGASVVHFVRLRALRVFVFRRPHAFTPTIPVDSTFIPRTISLYDSTATAGSDTSISFRTCARTCGEHSTTP